MLHIYSEDMTTAYMAQLYHNIYSSYSIISCILR